MSRLLEIRIDDRIATVTLNRPDKRNALNGELVDALQTVLDRLAENAAVRCIVLTGAGRVFSAGADLASLHALQDATAEESEADARRLARLLETLYRHPKAVIAKINGHAVAGGCGLAAACDVAVAADSARLGFTEVRIGFVPAIVSVFVLRKLGETAARDLLLSGRLVSAREAVRVGLITAAVPDGELDGAVADRAREIASETSGSAVNLTKVALGAVQDLPLADALDRAVEINVEARSTADCKAGVEAFLSKQDPPWKRR